MNSTNRYFNYSVYQIYSLQGVITQLIKFLTKHVLDVNVLMLKMEARVAQIRYSSGGGYKANTAFYLLALWEIRTWLHFSGQYTIPLGGPKMF